MVKIFEKIDKPISRLEKFIIGYATIIMIGVMFINVVLRYVFKFSFSWSDEVARYINMFVTFFAISAGIKYGAHVGVSAFVDYVVPKKARKYFIIFANVVTMVFCVFIAAFGFQLMMKQFGMNQVSPAMQIPMGLIYSAVPIGMLLSGIRSIQNISK